MQALRRLTCSKVKGRATGSCEHENGKPESVGLSCPLRALRKTAAFVAPSIMTLLKKTIIIFQWSDQWLQGKRETSLASRWF